MASEASKIALALGSFLHFDVRCRAAAFASLCGNGVCIVSVRRETAVARQNAIILRHCMAAFGWILRQIADRSRTKQRFILVHFERLWTKFDSCTLTNHERHERYESVVVSKICAQRC
jgi:hypothetical protein